MATPVSIISTKGRIRDAVCWAHVRHKFYDIETAHYSPAGFFL